MIFFKKDRIVFRSYSLLINATKILTIRRESFYLYEYIDDWEKFDKTSLLEKEDF